MKVLCELHKKKWLAVDQWCLILFYTFIILSLALLSIEAEQRRDAHNIGVIR